nr:single insulin-like growth factor-binding domain protein-1 [Procambarus clarkii]
MNTFILFSLLCLVVARCSGLSCTPCNPNNCQDPATLNCSWGTVRQACSCCQSCGGGPGAVCGGAFDTKGKCGPSLVCDKESKEYELFESSSGHIKGIRFLSPSGTCRLPAGQVSRHLS